MKKEIEVARFAFRSRPSEGATPLRAWRMDAQGRLGASAPVRDGVVELAAGPRDKVLLAPELPEGVELPPERLIRLGEVIRAADISLIDLPILPFCFCRVEGTVLNTIAGIAGDITRPACNVRVKVYEVDPWPLFIRRISDLELIEIGEFIPKIPWPPEPPPVERPPLGPIPGPDPAPPLFRGASAAKGTVGELLPLADKLALSSGNPALIRDVLLGGFDWFKPLLCHLRPRTPWYRRDLVDTVMTGSDGSFTAWFLHRCSDRPDLAFTVEVYEDGAWTQVYADHIPCGVRWNVECPYEVTLRLRDLRVPMCGAVAADDGKVVVVSFGDNVSPREVDVGTGEISGEGTTAPWAFGGTVEPRLAFGGGLGFTHYRWSRKVGAAWVPYQDAVRRHYLTTSTTFGSVVINDDDQPEMIPVNPALPANGVQFVVLNPRVDLATARFATEGLDPGVHRFRLEFFRRVGGEFQPVTVPAGSVHEVTSAAPFPGDPPPGVDNALSARRYMVAGGLRGYEIGLRVDNQKCTAHIGDPKVGAVTVNPCGFLEYTNGSQLSLSFEASHPGGYAGLSFRVVRGATDVGQVSGDVTAASVAGGPFVGASQFVRSGATFSAVLAPGDLLNAGGHACSRAAFAEHLDVSARITDGYGRLSHLDAPDLRAFALTPAGT